ncbi:hypothetical protein OJAV_G00135740 [Oryzias javanicus]|uniref:DUF6729 domain-containing protein n=1 Tax=Oryzias javanicus TaxID=123683 RepID=A0A437CKX5_ORYJA|nr:hypothetical protein OJAV_G00135740 [Oryzias javanicus]
MWPPSAGDEPAPSQRRWPNLYNKVATASARTTSAQSSNPSSSRTLEPPSVGSIVSTRTITAVASSSTAPQGISTDQRPNPAKRVKLCLSLETSKFGGKHVMAPKPNLNVPHISLELQVRDVPDSAEDAPSSARLSMQTQQTIPPSPDPFRASPVARFIRKTAPAPSTAHTHVSVDLAPFQSDDPAPLPLEWTKTMPQEDRRWVSSALFTAAANAKLKLRSDLQLWYHPPPPDLVSNQVPTPSRFFCHSLLLWMPSRLWKVRLVCTNPACSQHPLSTEVHNSRVLQVLDIDSFYNLVTEILKCSKCSTRYLSWSQKILKQLDPPHRSEFRVLLTQRYACDIRVVRLLRERGLGNSLSRIIGQLKESHREEWLQRVARYTSECAPFMKSHCQKFQEPPKFPDVPSYKWLHVVYSQDILNRCEDIKANITSTYGSILKLDSTREITLKLNGPDRGTAQRLTSVGNEQGQVLISVLSAGEGPALDLMATGLTRRFQAAGVKPPDVLYVDGDCCKEAGPTELKAKFKQWPNLIVRLDFWHFMLRLADGVTTAAHQLFPEFMVRLSACIFEWDAGDIMELRKAKRAQLQQQGRPEMTERDLDRHITKEELALHCRRRTRGEETTIHLIEQLLTEFMSAKGNDSLGVRLLDSAKMWKIWHDQKHHVSCIQDPPGVEVYKATGILFKGGVSLKTFCCTRGSASLGAFHRHLNRVIPGNRGNSLYFQMYLLEGLHRWNQFKAAGESAGSHTDTRDLLHSVHTNYQKVFGKQFDSSFKTPAKYTGELIGVDYLLRQNKNPLLKTGPDAEETSRLMEQLDVEPTDDKLKGEESTLTDLGISGTTSAMFFLHNNNPALLLPSVEPSLPARPQQHRHQQLHRHRFPSNTVGLTRTTLGSSKPPATIKKSFSVQERVPESTFGSRLVSLPPKPVTVTPPAATSSALSRSSTTDAYQERRKHSSTIYTTDRTIGRHRTQETGYRQHREKIYHPNKEVRTRQEWLERRKK